MDTQVGGEAGSALMLTTANDIDSARAAAAIRANKIPWFDLSHRALRRELWDLADKLDEASIRLRQGSGMAPLLLSPQESEAAIKAMSWTVERFDFDPDGSTGDIRRLLNSLRPRLRSVA